MRNLSFPKIESNFKITIILYCGYPTFSLPVNPYMSLQRALGCKTLSTDLTGERLFPCKDKVVSWQHRLPAPKQHSQIELTEVWPDLTCVSSQVLFQLSCVHELVMTLCTFRQRFTFIIIEKKRNH